MAVSRYYSSVARRTTLTADVNGTTTSMQVAAATGWPSLYPYTLIIDQDTVSEEIVTVTNRSGQSLTVIRGVDGTSGTSHTAGAVVEHGVSARDFTESRQHEDATETVHGLGAGSAVVGTTDAQTLTNKTLTAPTINNGIATGLSLSAPTVGDLTNMQHDHSTATKGGNIPQSSVTGLVSGLAAKESVTNVAAHTGATAAHGATGAVVGTTNTQTLTNKTLTSPAISSPTVTGTVTATGATVSGGTLSGQTVTGATLGGNLTAAGNKVTGLGTPTATADAATKGYVDTSVASIIDAAPGTLDTLNELAAALGDDPNFATTVTNSIATKLTKAGDTMTGNLAMSGGAKVTGLPTPSASGDAASKGYIDTLFGSTTSAATSATNAATSASNAATSATSATGSATSASTSASSAGTSATAASGTASAAATSASQASTSASNAATSATNSANSASAASTSQVAAAASATSAGSSATAASGSASAASSSATAAAASESLAEDWATKTTGTVDGVEFSAKYYAQQANPAGTVTETGTQTLTNKTISGSANTLSNIAQSAVTDLVTDLSGKVSTSDSRLTDARTPTAHAASHGSAGGDPITVAQSQVTNLTSDLSAKAPLASPTFTGTPVASTAAADTNSTQLATTAFVVGQAGSTTPAVNGTAAVGSSLRYSRQDHVHGTDTTRAPLASPTFTGTPTAPTAAVTTNTTQIATTAFVNAEIANDAVLDSTFTTKGDIIAASGANTPVRVAVGTNNQVLTADSAQASGVKWAAPATGGPVIGTMPSTNQTYIRTPISTMATNITPQTTWAYYAPIILSRSYTATELVCRTGNTFSGTHTVSMELRGADSNNYIGSRLAHGTISATTSNTAFALTIASQTLLAGLYWLGFHTTGGTFNGYDAGNSGIAQINTGLLASVSISALMPAAGLLAAGVSDLPATVPFMGSGSGAYTIPYVWLRV